MPTLDDPFRLFVYGTLMRDGPNAAALAGQRFLGVASTVARYDLLDLGDYPGLVHATNAGRCIEGELFLVDIGLVPLLDRIEGAPTLFRLEALDLLDGSSAVAYFYQRDTSGRRSSAPRWNNRR